MMKTLQNTLYILQEDVKLHLDGENLVIKSTKDNSEISRYPLHTLDYSRYTKLLEQACFRNDVELIKVNPFYTSQVAKWKYCNKRKMTVHEGASWMIARKGQNYNWFLKDMNEYISYKNK